MALNADQTPSASSLPAQPNTLLGRDKAVATASNALLRPECRLLTLLGTGGIGKTRLAVAVAQNLVDRFEDGDCFVDLTQISDPTAFSSLLAAQLGLQIGGSTPLGRVREHLSGRQLILLLDNFEHVLPAAIVVAELLDTCPGLKVLVTSREPLHLRWEQRMVVSPLDLPDLHQQLSTEELNSVPAVALFLQRAAALNLRFAVDDETLRQIAAVCIRLEGVPLAIELAARRTNLLSPAAMLARLDESASILQQRAPDVPTRHESIQSTLDWSYDLLTEQEQAGFRRLGVFVGGFSLEAAEAVMERNELKWETLELLSSLADKCLIMADPTPEGEPRYRLPQTVRAYALERLERTMESDEVAAAHAAYYLSLAECQHANLRYGAYLVFAPTPRAPDTSRREPWPLLLDREYANVRAALRWTSEHDDVMLLRLAGVLARYWWLRGYLQEGTQWLELAISRNAVPSTELRIRALNGLGILAWRQGDFARAVASLEEAVALARALDDTELLTGQLLDLAATLSSFEQLARATRLYEEVATLSRSRGDDWGIAAALSFLGMLDLRSGRGDAAEDLFMQTLPLFRALGDVRSECVIVGGLAQAVALQGNMRWALTLLDEALQIRRELTQETLFPTAIELVAWMVSREGAFEPCARLLGAGEALRARGYARTGDERQAYEHAMATVGANLDKELLAAALAAGRRLSAAQAFDEAVALVQTVLSTHDQATTESKPAETSGLSAREQEVVALLVEGCPNKEIGRRLGVSENTAKFHVTSILNKLGVNRRAEAVAVAVRRGLV